MHCNKAMMIYIIVNIIYLLSVTSGLPKLVNIAQTKNNSEDNPSIFLGMSKILVFHSQKLFQCEFLMMLYALFQ